MRRQQLVAVLLATLALTASACSSDSGASSAGEKSNSIPPGRALFVAPNGNDANDGSAERPWATLQHAADVVEPGDVVQVADGEYVGGFVIARSGTADKPITFTAAAGATPTIQIVEAFNEGLVLRGASYLTVNGFEFEYTAPGADTANGERYENGIVVTDAPGPVLSHHITITNNNVHGFPGGGIGSVLADYVTIEGNTIWDNARWSKFQGSGISLYQNVDFDGADGPHNVIRANRVFGNENRVPNDLGIITDGNCIIIDDTRQTQKYLDNKTQYPPATGQTLVENNVCSNNGGRGVHVFLSDNVLARHNTLFQNQQTPTISDGELTAGESGDVRFENNIVYAADDKPANNVSNSTDVVFERNAYFNASTVTVRSDGDLVGEDPLFVDPSADVATANFELQPSSPALDAATGDHPAIDIVGEQRPQGSTADLGAYERPR
jgi:parallel beta-helix repeat protein